jgi:hypothetical protein
MDIKDILNLDMYPVDDSGTPGGQALIDRCSADLSGNLHCAIPDFVSPQALALMAEEATGLKPEAYHNHSLRNCYLHQAKDVALPDDHARNLQDRSSVRMIAYDQLADASPLRTFYQSEMVQEMVAGIVGEGRLYPNVDPYQPANYVCYEDGDESSWHFDADNSFTMTLMIQPAEKGGIFQMSPNTRSTSSENYNQVTDVLTGKRDDTIVSIGREPGALCIFKGCHSLHRVSPVVGDRRIMGVFVYEFSPGIGGDPQVNATIYGPRTLDN